MYIYIHVHRYHNALYIYWKKSRQHLDVRCYMSVQHQGVGAGHLLMFKCFQQHPSCETYCLTILTPLPIVLMSQPPAKRIMFECLDPLPNVLMFKCLNPPAKRIMFECLDPLPNVLMFKCLDPPAKRINV